jgi:glycosyltransferase involved in cell wall biosynthesis
MDASTISSEAKLGQGAGARSPLRIAVITETYPPEINGVALTLQRMLEGLRARRHVVQLVRLRQHADDLPQRARGFHEVLMRGVPIPRYSHLRMGVPCAQALQHSWAMQRPDVVHIATEGPLGWSALRAAKRLGLPVVSDFRTNFHAYSRHYGVGWLQRQLPARLSQSHAGDHGAHARVGARVGCAGF